MGTHQQVVGASQFRPFDLPTSTVRQITYAVKNRGSRTVEDTAQRDALIQENMVVVETIVGKLLRGRQAPNIEKGDLLSVGGEEAIRTVDRFLTGKARGIPLAKCIATNCLSTIRRFIKKQHRTAAGALAAEGMLRCPRAQPEIKLLADGQPDPDSTSKWPEDQKPKGRPERYSVGYDAEIGPQNPRVHRADEFTGRGTAADFLYGTSLVFKERFFDNGDYSNGFIYQFFPITEELAEVDSAAVVQCAPNHPRHGAYMRAAGRSRERGRLFYPKYPIKD